MLLRFGLVGSLGFLVDAGILTLLVNGFSWHHYAARAVSFAVAVTITWALNRRYVFTKTDDSGREYTQYFTVQVIGALLNLGTYVAVIQARPNLSALPVIPLGIGAVLGLLFNFIAARFLVYGHSARHRHPAAGNSPESSYSGRENLEAMKHARNYNRFLLDLVRKHAPGGTVLDFGAGAGTFAKPMADAGYSVLCVEPDAELRSMLNGQGLAARASIEEIAPDSVDYVYTLNVLEHIEDDARAITELCAKLRAHGRLFIYVPAFGCLFSSMDRNVGHFRRYRIRQLRRLVEGAGLRTIEARYVDSAGFFATLLFKLIGDESGTISPRSVGLYDRLAFPVSRAADLLLGKILGKNLLVVAAKAGDA